MIKVEIEIETYPNALTSMTFEIRKFKLHGRPTNRREERFAAAVEKSARAVINHLLSCKDSRHA